MESTQLRRGFLPLDNTVAEYHSKHPYDNDTDEWGFVQFAPVVKSVCVKIHISFDPKTRTETGRFKPFFGLHIFPPFSEFCSPLVPLRYFALSFPGILYNFLTQRRDYPSPPNIPAGQPFFFISSQVTAAKVSLLFHAPLVCIPLNFQCAGAHAHRFRGWAVFRLW